MGKLKDNRRNKGARPREASLKNSHCGSSALPPFCPSQALGGIADSLRLQCPLRIERSLPEKNIQPIFDALSSIFPKIRHLTVEESSALPSAFS
ncbi:5'-adenylylsulfate reductase-like 6 isoform X2 [Dendrobium catenatum]|uniref:5'-adenylylsulfate reductase-like 6 isoform X2 n=1 Tax=Dendrobium catenatum TaxID=906689 RepID=UPI0009F53122|nr:5'-adenylylsulfate reductase-like 6 isoform X2 [Dendrobium catenatum]